MLEPEQTGVARVDMRRAALDLAETGIRVFPVFEVAESTLQCTCAEPATCSAGKHPRVRDWQTAATDDAVQIEVWWSRWPEASIGLPTGGCNRIVVADFDAEVGLETLARLELENGGAFKTPTAATGKGRHLYFAAENTTLRNAARLLPGVDRRANGGFVVAPRSLHASGRRYEWLIGLGVPLLPVPHWLLDPPVEPVEHLPLRNGHGHVDDSERAYVLSALEREAASVRASKPGTRNDRLNLAAYNLGTLVGGGALLESTAHGQLLAAALACGLKPREALATIASGLSAGIKDPRTVPRRQAPHHPVGATGNSDVVTASGETSNDNAREAKPRYVPIADGILRSMAPLGRRLRTGLPTFDAAIGGGIPARWVTVLVGAPGTAKSTIATALVHRWELEGAACVYAAVDEAASGIMARIGQLEGYARDTLMAETPHGDRARHDLAERLRARGCRISVIDLAFDATRTLEEMHEALLEFAEGRPRVLVVDSLQRIRCAAAEHLTDIRLRTNTKVEVIRELANRGTLFVVLSEMNRGAYDMTSDRNPLAAGKESSDIEYGGDIQINLYRAKAPGFIDLTIPKSRWPSATNVSLRLRLDFERASISEVNAAAGDGSSIANGSSTRDAARAARQQVETDGLARQLARLVHDLPRLGTIALRQAAQAKLGWGVTTFRRAEARLREGLEGHQLVDASADPHVCEWVVTDPSDRESEAGK
jgi:KaiC/GvpD/RAD55 family RecA-like ATPase